MERENWSGIRGRFRPALFQQPRMLRVGFRERAGLERKSLAVNQLAAVEDLRFPAVALAVEAELAVTPPSVLHERPDRLAGLRLTRRPRRRTRLVPIVFGHPSIVTRAVAG